MCEQVVLNRVSLVLRVRNNQCTIIMNISSYLGTKYMFEAQKYPGWTTGEISKVVGLLAYYDAIIKGVVLILLIIELIVSIIASKKLADKRLNVL